MLLHILPHIFSLQLSFLQWIGRKFSSREFNKSFIFTKTLAQKGRLLDPNNHVFLDVLGILFDIEGKHEKARKQFEKSGRLRSDPYWRLLMATSWHMSGEPDKSLHELQLSENEGAKGRFFDFYYGRALNSVGNSTRAINYLKSAYDKRGNRPELLRELSLSYHYNGEFFSSAKYAFLLAMNIMFTSLRFMMQNLSTATIRVVLGLTCPISKVCWKIIKHIPLVRYLQLKYFPPDEPELTLGLTLIEKGNYEAAEQNFRTSCRIIPNKAGSHINLGLCLALQGREDEALMEYDKAIKLNPHDKMFKSVRDQIASGNMKRIVD
jgi:Flp pilus assembly protein TadD